VDLSRYPNLQKFPTTDYPRLKIARPELSRLLHSYPSFAHLKRKENKMKEKN